MRAVIYVPSLRRNQGMNCLSNGISAIASRLFCVGVRRRVVTGIIIFVASTSAAVNARAGAIITDEGNAGLRSDGGFTIGFRFTVGASNLLVSDLGVWDDVSAGGTNGLVFAHPTAIFD